MVNIMLAGMAGLAVLFIFFGLAQTLGRPSQVQQRLELYGPQPRSLEEIELSQPFSERVFVPLVRGMSRMITRLSPQRNTENVRHLLDLAGNPHNWTPSDFLGVRGLCAIVVAVLLVFFFIVLRADPALVLLALGAGGVLGFFLPLLWLRMKIRRRQHDIQRELPDALDLLTTCVEAGLAFDSAMAKVAEKWDNELSRGFARVIAEVRVGKLRRDALRDMATRMEVPDMTNFIAAVIQADQLGVSIAKVLRIQAEQMRIKRRQRAEELANQAPVKMLIPLAFLVFPSIFIVLLGPTVLIFMNGGFGVH